MNNLNSIVWWICMFLVLANKLTLCTLEEPAYTENLEAFQNSKHKSSRMQRLLGCWLYIADDIYGSTQDNFDELILPLLKRCIKDISRKDVVLKITSLGNKNQQPVRPFSEALHQPIIQKQLPVNYQISEFDLFLLKHIESLQQQIKELRMKGSIQHQLQRQMQNRKKYYFGFIPANSFNHSVILVGVSLVLLFAITWCKSKWGSAKNQEQKKERMKKEQESKQQLQIKLKKLLQIKSRMKKMS